MAIKVNQDILEERHTLLELQKSFIASHTLTKEQTQTLEDLAKKYDFFTRLKGKERIDRQISKLFERIDVIPPSILIAISAIETDWGKASFAINGNALYREISWNDKSGIIPEDEKEDASYSIKRFPSLYASMGSFARKINSNINYDSMKVLRQEMRYRKKIIDGQSLATTFILYSPKNNFIGLLDYTITFYKLTRLDNLQLQKKIPLPKNEKK